jgi:hypothetical protein
LLRNVDCIKSKKITFCIFLLHFSLHVVYKCTFCFYAVWECFVRISILRTDV